MTMFGCCIAIAALTTCLAKQETHRFIHIEQDGKAVAQDVIHDQEANTVMVIIGDVSKYEGYTPTVNLHDFNTGYVAFKDIGHKMCLLTRTPYPRAMPEVYRMGFSNITMEYTTKGDSTPLNNQTIEEVAGSTIAEFCRDYVTYLRELVPAKHASKRFLEEKPDELSETKADQCTIIICLFCRIVPGNTKLDSLLEPDPIVG